MRRAPVLLVLLLAAVLLVPPANLPVTAAPVPDRLAVTAWILEGSSPRLVARNADRLTTLGVADVTLAARGGSVSAPTDDARRLLRAAHRNGLTAELLMSNYSNALHGFAPTRAHALLSDPRRIARVAQQVAGFVTDDGWDGVNVDLEQVRAGDGPGLVDLVRALQARMPAERTVSVDVSATTSARSYRRHGYRLGGLAGAADVIDLMTYDQHGAGWTGPGPIGALPWQRAALEALLTEVPAAQVQLGVAGYGYTWPRHRTGRDVAVQQARGLVRRDGATAHWRGAAGEWTARLSDGTVLWWSDGRSYGRRVDLAREYGVRGLAVWRLGSADTLE